MDLQKIKNLIKKNGDKFILVENDAPEIVMMSFGEYEKLTEDYPEPFNYSRVKLHEARLPDGQGSSLTQKPRSMVESLETDRPEETEFIIPLGPAERRPAKPVRLEDISLEDLPL